MLCGLVRRFGGGGSGRSDCGCGRLVGRRNQSQADVIPAFPGPFGCGSDGGHRDRNGGDGNGRGRCDGSARLRNQLQAGNDLSDHANVNLVELHFATQSQRIKAKVVDGAGSAVAGLGDQLDCACCEQGMAKIARHFDPVVDVADGLFGGERLDVADGGDALAKLDERSLEQLLRELRLAGENDLNHLAARGFKVGEEANALKDGVGKVLRLVDDDDEFAAGAILLDDGIA